MHEGGKFLGWLHPGKQGDLSAMRKTLRGSNSLGETDLDALSFHELEQAFAVPRPAEPSRSPSLEVLESSTFHIKPKRLLDVSDVAEWLGVSKGCVRDHALGRRQPRLFAIKLGPAKGRKGPVEVS
jgi:hypothetical protein